jgi:hypothetical protein
LRAAVDRTAAGLRAALLTAYRLALLLAAHRTAASRRAAAHGRARIAAVMAMEPAMNPIAQTAVIATAVTGITSVTTRRGTVSSREGQRTQQNRSIHEDSSVVSWAQGRGGSDR